MEDPKKHLLQEQKTGECGHRGDEAPWRESRRRGLTMPHPNRQMNDHRTINEVILAVMKEAGVPLSGKEAYQRIVEKQLYKFHAQKAEHVVTSQIRRHCKELVFLTDAPNKYFYMSE